MRKHLQKILSLLCVLALVLGTVPALVAESSVQNDARIITVAWDDGENYDGLRPASVKAAIAGQEVELKEENGWAGEASIPHGSTDEWTYNTPEGYVASNYILGGVSFSPVMAPQPVAKAKREITLKNGTGLFAGTVASFPAGTKMHVVMEDGDWLYVDVPRGEMEYLMDPEGTFGYVKKEDVLMASMICMLDWTE